MDIIPPIVHEFGLDAKQEIHHLSALHETNKILTILSTITYCRSSLYLTQVLLFLLPVTIIHVINLSCSFLHWQLLFVWMRLFLQISQAWSQLISVLQANSLATH